MRDGDILACRKPSQCDLVANSRSLMPLGNLVKHLPHPLALLQTGTPQAMNESPRCRTENKGPPPPRHPGANPPSPAAPPPCARRPRTTQVYLCPMAPRTPIIGRPVSAHYDKYTLLRAPNDPIRADRAWTSSKSSLCVGVFQSCSSPQCTRAELEPYFNLLGALTLHAVGLIC